MTPDKWKKIDIAFQQALELSGSAREEFLDNFSCRNPELGEQLRNLIAADSDENIEIGAPIAASVESLAREAKDPWIGRAIGSWTITQRLAGGGMGVVFLAERSDEQYLKTVAVKVMAAQLLAPDAISRFKVERQILANLNHAYIATLIDGGSTDEGLPFLVMEYVNGLPIDQYCDDNKLAIDRRLGLFCKVCEAVDYAHRNLVVHRDLKPSNIMIDANGDPKLLDFGIAKLIEAGSYNHTIAMTREGTRAMTPEYASPEQVRGEPISVATDVYSLGVLLYRLMTGQSPYGTTVSSPLEYERAIIEHDPHRPSAVITSPDGEENVVVRRDTSPKKLKNRLSGDLDNIVLKTLQKEPDRRYLSASALSADIQRFLQDEPVEARGDAWSYRARKFAVRHSRGLAITGIVLTTVASLITFYTIRLADERDRANLAAAESAQVATFLTDLFQSASPFVAQGESVTAINVLEAGLEKIEELSDQPILQAELYRIMGDSFTGLGEYALAIPLLEKSVGIRATESVPSLELADSLEALGEAQRQHRDYVSAIENRKREVAIRTAELGADHKDVARALSRLGATLHSAQKDEEALEVLGRALTIKRRLSQEEDPVTLDILGITAVVLDSMGRYEEAAAANRKAIALSNEMIGELHPNTVIRISNLALVLRRQYKLNESAKLFLEAIERGNKIWPPDHPSLSFYMQSYANVLESLGRFAEAFEIHQNVASITRAGPGEHSINYSGNLYGQGGWHSKMGRHDKAIEIFQRGHDIAADLQDENGYFVVLNMIYLGASKASAGQYEEAERILLRAIEKRDHIGTDHGLKAQISLASLYSEQGQFNEADRLIQETIAEKEAGAGSDSASLIEYFVPAAAHYRRAGDLEKSKELSSRAHDIARNALPQGNWIAALGIAEYAHTLIAMNQRDEAKKLFREAHSSLLATFGEEDLRVVELAKHLQ